MVLGEEQMFYALLTGTEGGCDYTIGCNKTFKKLKASNWADAYKESEELCEYYGAERIESINILEVTEERLFDVAKYQKDLYDKEQEEIRLEKETEEKRLYEKLKKSLSNAYENY